MEGTKKSQITYFFDASISRIHQSHGWTQFIEEERCFLLKNNKHSSRAFYTAILDPFTECKQQQNDSLCNYTSDDFHYFMHNLSAHTCNNL